MKSKGIIFLEFQTIVGALLILTFGETGILNAQQPKQSMYQSLHYRFIGPGGNRVSAVIGEPGNPLVYYAGAASGGLWKSTDAGTHWKPIFDSTGVQSIGTIAITKSQPHTIWVGTGEPYIRSNVSIGNGIYKSTDAGRTWHYMGLTKTGRIARIEINPNNPNIVYACAQGTDYGPQKERGVFRTKDGGKTWEKVLFVDEKTGCSGMDMDSHNPNILFAGMWQYYLKTWGQFSGGPGSGVFVTRDGGDHWKKLTQKNGLPGSPLGKISVAVAPNNSNRVYALIETGGKGRGSLWRSDDGGYQWKVVNHSQRINERPHYYTRMQVAPDNYNTVWFPSNNFYVTRDGGETIQQTNGGGDNHAIWADPTNADRMMIGDDGGVLITVNKGRSWNRTTLPIGQMYHVMVDRDIPYNVYSNMQDDASIMGPSINLGGRAIQSSTWHTTTGCESGWSTPDTVSDRWVWSNCYAGAVSVYDRKTGYSRAVAPWPDKSLDSPAKVLKYRWNWQMPLAISPHDHNKVYVGSQYIHMTEDGGQSWKVISPDLTLNDTTRMGSSGGLVPDNLGVEYWGTLFAIAVSPVKEGVIWAGSNDGLVHVTKNDGKSWQNVTRNIPDLPKYGTISSITPSSFNAGTAYISVDFHQVNNRNPYIYKTDNFGKSWTKITDGIQNSVFSYVHVVKEDPARKGLLFAGTEDSLYVSFNDGKHWQPLQNNLPPAPVSWLTIQPVFHDLVVATKGRGLYILDDITPLEQTNSKIHSSKAHLFKPRTAYRFRKIRSFRGSDWGDDVSAGQNPPYGASINYYLKENSNQPVQIEILNQSGQVIRTLQGSSRKGIHRAWWNLRYPPTKEVKLRTTSKQNPYVMLQKRFRGKKTREIYHWGIFEPKLGPLVNPGTYKVRLKEGNKTFTQSLTIKKDPNTTGTLADVQKETAMWLDVYHNINHVVTMINQIERIRKQIEDLPIYLKGHSDSTEVMKYAHTLDKKALKVENQLRMPYLTGGLTKTYPEKMRLYLKLVWFAAEVGSGGGDVAGDNTDAPPTTQEKQVYKLLSKRLDKATSDFNKLMNQDVPSFNNTVAKRGVHTLIVSHTKKD